MYSNKKTKNIYMFVLAKFINNTPDTLFVSKCVSYKMCIYSVLVFKHLFLNIEISSFELHITYFVQHGNKG